LISSLILIIIGGALVVIGSFCSLVAAIGILRLPNFFTRIHALTINIIGGTFTPLIGCGFITLGLETLGSERLFIAGGIFFTAILIVILGPAGSHALTRAAYRSKAVSFEPKFINQLEKEQRGD